MPRTKVIQISFEWKLDFIMTDELIYIYVGCNLEAYSACLFVYMNSFSPALTLHTRCVPLVA